ncbi:uncharacterized protein DSM5745_06846 [Aspergillus mulundensis]|uniref:Fe2OG dioxygenase domain-containing protein n=1 Tax=Aspergillus mulundensis TaxID=1810919 RepID=A0A3D8RSK3_9EURO|nr:Uncharacterized protein DSM5745_06846 [Aspergillus mulundensis]RDW76854.1 Uncharacterized protein DSM5745_06846 [Aspergillus mulundensis]
MTPQAPSSEFTEHPTIPGLYTQPSFITIPHETELITLFATLPWPNRPGRISLHYGYTFDYKTFGIDPAIPYIPFPTWLQPLIPTTESRPPDQVCLQYYPPGSGIPPHVDSHRGWDQLYALSLGAPVLMRLRNGKGGDEKVDIDLAPRSMMCFSGESRLHWTHGIGKRKNDTLPDGIRARGDRWSITFRWVREGACECGDVELCDSAQERLGIEKEKRSVLAAAAAAAAAAAVSDCEDVRGEGAGALGRAAGGEVEVQG